MGKFGWLRVSPWVVLAAGVVCLPAFRNAFLAHTMSAESAVSRFLVVVVVLAVGWSCVRSVVEGYLTANDDAAHRATLVTDRVVEGEPERPALEG
jgi:hypothetical protein